MSWDCLAHRHRRHGRRAILASAIFIIIVVASRLAIGNSDDDDASGSAGGADHRSSSLLNHNNHADRICMISADQNGDVSTTMDRTSLVIMIAGGSILAFVGVVGGLLHHHHHAIFENMLAWPPRRSNPPEIHDHETAIDASATTIGDGGDDDDREILTSQAVNEAQATNDGVACSDSEDDVAANSSVELHNNEANIRINDDDPISLKTLSEAETKAVEELWNNESEAVFQERRSNPLMTARAIRTLRDGHWLNDEVIYYYFSILLRRNRSNRGVEFFDSYFFAALLGGTKTGYSYSKSVQGRTKRIDIFIQRLVMIPLHVRDNHWSLGVINLEQKRFQYYDSLKGATPPSEFFQTLRKYLQDEHKNKRNGAQLDTSDWTDEVVADIPKQNNEDDCGVFTIKYADCLSQNLPLNFAQADMPYFRRRITLQIAAGTL